MKKAKPAVYQDGDLALIESRSTALIMDRRCFRRTRGGRGLVAWNNVGCCAGIWLTPDWPRKSRPFGTALEANSVHRINSRY